MDAIKDALEKTGVHFVDPNGLVAGVRLREKYSGHSMSALPPNSGSLSWL